MSEFPTQSPLFHAEHAERYARQQLIREYQDDFDCRLVVMIDSIFWPSVTWFEELIYNASPKQNLHLLLDTPGGDGEIAVRLARSIQSRCSEFVVIVPNQAKSAGTVLTMGANRILMGPTSDLGPVDPQFQLPDGTLVSAKEIISAVETATQEVQENPDTYTVYASLLENVNALMVEQAKSALNRSDDLVREALKSNPTLSAKAVDDMAPELVAQLVTEPWGHGAVFGAPAASDVGLPVESVDPGSKQWQIIWRLWSKYFANWGRYYEGENASRVMPWPYQSVAT